VGGEAPLILSAAAAGTLSTAFCGSQANLLGLWGLTPLLWLEARSRRAAFFMMFVFYLSISRGIPPGAYVFFQDGSLVRALALWFSSGLALALPWGLLWSAERKGWRVVLAALVSIPPPLGLIGWGNPLTAAGLFFPGLGWFGLALALALYALAAVFPKLRRTLIVLILLAAPLLNVPALSERAAAGGVTIQGLSTSFGRLASGSGDFEGQYERERLVFRYVGEKRRKGDFEGADAVVLPETVIGRMNPAVMKRWEKFFAPFSEKGMVFIAGGEIPAGRGAKYDNVMVSFVSGGKRRIAKQRFPVPFSMYRPFGGEGANASLFSLGEVSIMEVRGVRLGFLVCYEQFLSWPFLSLTSQKPEAIVAPSNLWWCKDTSLPGIRAAALCLWARLFGLPAVMSANE
jgi:apolipoprotein N-acyltransferase